MKFIMVTKTVKNAQAAIAAVKQLYPVATVTLAPAMRRTHFNGLPCRDDYGTPVRRCFTQISIEGTVDMTSVENVAYEAAGNWLII